MQRRPLLLLFVALLVVAGSAFFLLGDRPAEVTVPVPSSEKPLPPPDVREAVTVDAPGFAPTPGGTEPDSPRQAVAVEHAPPEEPPTEPPASALHRFHGRVVDADTGRPIEGVEVKATESDVLRARLGHAGTSPTATSDADGRFLLEDSRESGTFELRATSYAVQRFVFGPGHEVPERARELRLSRAARLTVRLSNAGGETVGLELTTPAYHASPGMLDGSGQWSLFGQGDLSWRSTIEPGAAAVVEGLLPRAPLTISLSVPGRPVQVHTEPVTLEPGEHRELTLALGETRLTGVVRHEDGAPIGDLPMWFLASERAGVRYRRVLEANDERDVLLQTRTDAQGRFVLTDLAPGSYWIGPAATSKREGLFALATAVDISEGEDRHVELEIPAPLYMSGRVLGPDGEAAKSAHLLVSSEELHVTFGNVADDGAFRIGPVPPGEYIISTLSMIGESSEPLACTAGAQNLVIQLRSGGSLKGRVVDAATGEVQSAEVRFVSAQRGTSSRFTQGDFEQELQAGTYTVIARASGPRIAVLANVVVSSGEATDDVLLRLEPAAEVRIVYKGEHTYAQMQVRWSGGVVAFDGIRTGTDSQQQVPAGDIEVELSAGGDRLGSQRVIARAGEVVEVVFD